MLPKTMPSFVLDVIALLAIVVLAFTSFGFPRFSSPVAYGRTTSYVNDVPYPYGGSASSDPCGRVASSYQNLGTAVPVPSSALEALVRTCRQSGLSFEDVLGLRTPGAPASLSERDLTNWANRIWGTDILKEMEADPY